jgi:anti-anti-sigma factor
MFRLLDTSASPSLSRPAVHETDPSGALPVCAISVHRYDGWTAVMLRGELDYSSASELVNDVRTELIDDRPVIIELVGLEFADIHGVRALASLVEIGERCRGHAGVELHGARGQVRKLIRMLGYRELLPPDE